MAIGCALSGHRKKNNVDFRKSNASAKRTTKKPSNQSCFFFNFRLVHDSHKKKQLRMNFEQFR